MFTLLEIISVLIISIIFLISFINLISAPRLTLKQNFSMRQELVSILIPARNEEKNITDCINKCLDQSYPNKEIIVLNDNSTDSTKELLQKFSNHIKIIDGAELPEGWLGKNWACHQLSLQAKGKYFLFIDADVRLNEKAVEAAINEINLSETGMLSVFPTQQIKSFSEWLIVPLMNWLLLGLLPLALVYKSKHKSFVAANGQFMLWRKDTYHSIGGHSAVKAKIVEDMEFARLCKLNGIKIKTLLGNELVFCRMYSNLGEAMNGFSKNFFPGFNINSFSFLIFVLLISIASVYPFFAWNNFANSSILLIEVVLSRIFISLISKQNILINIFLHPVQMIFVLVVGFISVYKTHNKKLEWKERKI